MAAVDVKGVNNTLGDTNSPATIVPRGEFNVNEYVAIDTYTTAAIESGSTIEMCPDLPLGAYVTGIVVAHSGLGTNVTLAIGDGTDADKYLAASAAATAGKLEADLNLNSSVSGGNIVLTTGGATADAAATVNVIVRYVLK